MTRSHPSARTNNKILNGNEMVVGGSINIPLDISTDETTISITINGMYIKKPNIKAVQSSLSIKAGTRVVKGKST